MRKILISIILVFLFCCLTVSVPINAVFAQGNEYNAKSLYLMDYNTGEVLFEKDAEKQIPVASIVKLMTILITMENISKNNIDLNDVVIVSENAAGMGGSQVFLETGGEYTVDSLLKSTIVSSANDASVALSELIAGSEKGFVEIMNKKAVELSLENTHYINCTGLPAVGQFSCAKDVAKLLREVTKHDLYFKYSTIWMDTLQHANNRQTELVNTNKLIRYYKGCNGGKTGSTNEAGYCLAATAKRGDMQLIGVVLGAESGKERFAQTSKLLNYGFDNFVNKKVVSKEENVLNTTKITAGKEKEIKITCKNDIYLLCKRNEKAEDIEIKYEILPQITAPVEIGDVVGVVYVIKNGEIVREEELISNTKIEKATYVDNFIKAIKNWKIAA